MFQWMNKKLDDLSEFLAPRKGLLPLIGIGLIVLNYIFQFLPVGWLASTNLFLHLGLIVAILGLLLAWAL
jgi:hypothetical protein